MFDAPGGIVLPLFSGYGADAVATRLRDSEATTLFTADGFLRRSLSRPAVVIALVLLVAAAIAGRSLWWGDGTLFGGALLPSPDGAGELWAAYTDTWHDVGPGSNSSPMAPV